MAKGEAVKLPTTFKVQSATLPKRTAPGGHREKSAAAIALAEIVNSLDLGDERQIPVKGDREQAAVARHLRNAASDRGMGLRVIYTPTHVQFALQKKGKPRGRGANGNGNAATNTES